MYRWFFFKYCRLIQQLQFDFSWLADYDLRLAGWLVCWFYAMHKLAALCSHTTQKTFISPFAYQIYYVSLLMWMSTHFCAHTTIIIPCTSTYYTFFSSFHTYVVQYTKEIGGYFGFIYSVYMLQSVFFYACEWWKQKHISFDLTCSLICLFMNWWLCVCVWVCICLWLELKI